MTTRLHRGRLAAQPKWLRMLAMLCLLLVSVGSTAQAAHIHGDWLPHAAKHASLPASASQGQGEEHCPLCVAMHSALPATLQVRTVPLLVVQQRLTVSILRVPEKRCTFALFSRPPPTPVAPTAG